MEMWKISLLRELEYKILNRTTLSGKILDLWGSRKSWYHELIQWNHEFTVVNISEEYGYDLNFDIQEHFPLDNESYDNIIAINVLEHIYKHQNVINESFRVLKEWWKCISITPFIFNVHGSPDDYFRYTWSALMNIFTDAGFKKENIEITEIGEGIFSAFYQMISWIIPTQILKYIFRVIFVGTDRLLSKLSIKYKKLMKSYPLWYIICVTK